MKIKSQTYKVPRRELGSQKVLKLLLTTSPPNTPPSHERNLSYPPWKYKKEDWIFEHSLRNKIYV